MASLVPCAACARHVRAAERSCPFCGAAIEAAAPPEAPSMPADRLLARAAIAFAAAAAVSACGKTDAPPPPPPPPVNTNVAPAYGVPVVMVDGSAVEQAPPPVPAPKKK